MTRKQAKFFFLAPAIIWVFVFTIFPLGYSAVLSVFSLENSVDVTRTKVPLLDDAGEPVLTRSGKPRTRTVIERTVNSDWTFVGGKNFVRITKDMQAAEAAKVTVIFAVVAVTIQIVLGMALALLFNRKLPARGVMRSVMIMPIFATPIAVGYLFFTIFFENGGPLSFTGIPWLSNPSWALFSVILVDVWQWTPFAFLVFLAALQGIDSEQIEAARLDTESSWKIFTNIVLPALQPVIVIVLLLRFAEAIKVFDIPFALTGGGPGVATQSYTFLAFRTGLRFFDVGYASAMSYTLLIAAMIIVTVFFSRIRKSYS